jgi:hypothetical protein
METFDLGVLFIGTTEAMILRFETESARASFLQAHKNRAEPAFGVSSVICADVLTESDTDALVKTAIQINAKTIALVVVR